MKTIIFAFFFSVLPAAASAQTTQPAAADDYGLGPALIDIHASTHPFVLSPGADEHYDRGIAYMYRLEFDKAEAECRAITTGAPEDPAGYFALAALSWWRYSQDFDTQGNFKSIEKEFFKNADKVIELSQKMVRENRDLDQAYFFMGSAYGLEGRWYAVQRSWWKAYGRGKKGRKYLKKCIETNPAIYDAYLGLGIFDYYTATLPGTLGLAAKLFIGGDRERGMEYVKIAKEKGRFFRLEARIFLIEIYSRHEKDFKSAFEECAQLRALDPSNMLYRLAEILTHMQAQDWQGVLGEAEEFLSVWRASPTPGIAQQLCSVYLSAGDALIAMKRYDEARAWLTSGIEQTAFPAKGWVTYSYLRRAQALDLLGRREEALKDYGAAAGRTNFWDSKKYSKAGLKKAPDYTEVYRQMTED